MDEFKVKLSANSSTKKYDVFKLHKDDDVSWNEAKMKRENDYQPWQIKIGNGRSAKRYKAVKEGGVGDNASYYVFYKPKDKSDTYEVCPIDEWYNVSGTHRYKTLTAEEAEQRFEQRHKTLNLFSVMHLKKNGENNEEGLAVHNSKSFKVSELDEWDNEDDDDRSDNEDGGDSDDSRKKVKKKKIKKEDPDDAPEEAKEDSDEGDYEQREVDYMSDSSSDSSISEKGDDKNDVKGIAEEEALRDLLSTDDESDTDNPQQKVIKTDIKTILSPEDINRDPDANESDESSDSDDYDVDDEKMDSMFNKKSLPSQLSVVKQEVTAEPDQSSSKPPTGGNKRKLVSETVAPPSRPAKRPCPPETSSQAPLNSQEKIIEDLIKKYLSRKPMTLKNLLKDIKSKLKRMEGVTPEMDNDLVGTIASIIKRLQPDKQKINDATYYSLRS